MACVVAGVENGKHAIQEQITAGNFVSREPNVILEHAQAMNDVVNLLWR